MTDYANKTWLRDDSFYTFYGRMLRFAARCILLAVALFVIAWTLSQIDARATTVTIIMLDSSSNPATLDECQRARPQLQRPQRVISLQNGTGTPWHHRVCTY